MGGHEVSRNANLLGTGVAASVAALAALFHPARVEAQFRDPLSEVECPGCAAGLPAATAAERPAANPLARFGGAWSSPLTTAEDPAWAMEDFYCAAGCTPAARERAAAAFALPANARRPSNEIFTELAAADTRLGSDFAPRLTFACRARDLAQQALSALPISIEVGVARIVLRYEQFGAAREIGLDDARDAAAAHAARARGDATARLEHGSLVIESPSAGADGTPERTLERYTVSDDGRWLDAVVERSSPSDPTPRVLVKRWLRTPDASLRPAACDVMSAGLDATVADYVDLAKLDARRRARLERLTRR